MKRPKDFWEFRLYIAGNTRSATLALNNLKTMCNNHLCNNYHIEVIDLIHSPDLAERDEIFALPALVCLHPSPPKKIIGDLSNQAEVVRVLQLPVAEAEG